MPARTAPYPSFTFSRGWALIAFLDVCNAVSPPTCRPNRPRGGLTSSGPPATSMALGATLYVLLTGQAPFTEADLPTLLRQVEQGKFPRPRLVRTWIDPALEAVCLKAMARRPQDRYPSPRALAEDIEHWLADEPVKAYRDPMTVRLTRWARQHKSTAVGGGALLAAAVIAWPSVRS